MESFRSVGTTACPAIAADLKTTLGSFVDSIRAVNPATSIGPRGHCCPNACPVPRSTAAMETARMVICIEARMRPRPEGFIGCLPVGRPRDYGSVLLERMTPDFLQTLS